MTRRTVSPPAAPPSTATAQALIEALGALRAALADARFPLVAPGAASAAEASRAIAAQLDDYLLPRLARLDAPLLVVVGGSTGAGKSTLVNSIVRAPVSQAGALRPTTRSPVLVHSPSDGHWFQERYLLPGLPRTGGLSGPPGSLRAVAATGLNPGLALLDAPDIDSVVGAGRELANQLLAAADLWLFVTTAARYADAVPWSVLATARERGTALVMALNRVPPEAQDEIGGHLAAMLPERGLAVDRLFVLPEAALDGQGLLAEWLVQPTREWLAQLAADPTARAALVRQTVGGAVAALVPAVSRLVDAAEEQITTATGLRDAVQIGYAGALATVEAATGDGSVLRGEVLDLWQECAASGELPQEPRAPAGRLRDRIGAAVPGRNGPGAQLRTGLVESLATVISAAVNDAEERVRAAWRGQPELLAAHSRSAGEEIAEQARRLARLWQRWVLDAIRREAVDEPGASPAYPVNTAGLLVMLAVLAPPEPVPGSAPAAASGGATDPTPGLALALHATVAADRALRRLVEHARVDLNRRVRELFATGAARFTGVLVGAEISPNLPERLRAAGRAVASAPTVPAPRTPVPHQPSRAPHPAAERTEATA